MSGPALATVPSPPPRLHDLFGALDASGVRWSLLRPPRSLAEPAGDIDLLVEPQSVERVARLVAQQGFAAIPLGGDDLHAADYDRDSDRFLWLHVQADLRIGGDAVPAGAVLAAARRDPLPRPDDAWLLWILILHGLLDKGAIAARHRAEVVRLARAAPPPPEPLARIAERRGLQTARALELAAAGAREELESLPLSPPPAEPPRGAAIAGVAALAGRARGAWARRGIGVAVIGPDGAGKTTLVQGLRDGLPVATYTVYMGLTGGRLPRADALRVPGLVLAARLALLWVRWGVGLYHRAHGRIVLFDRYVLDGRVPSGAQLSPLARASRRLQAAACPRPDLVILLDASGATLHARSGEYEPDRLEHWRSRYRRLDGRVKGLAILDAEQPADAVRRDALALVWRCYVRRWQRRDT